MIHAHEQRLQELDPAARTEAIVDAIYADVIADPALAAALRRAGRIAIVRKMWLATQN